MKIKFLNTPWQRSIGAMFRKSLGNTALVFEYPKTAPRTFHTAFCGPLRIIALSDGGRVVYDQAAQPWRLVKLPATRFVIEIDPDAEVEVVALQQLVRNHRPELQTAIGSWGPEASLDRLFFALIAEAVADIRRVYEANGRKKTLCSNILRKAFKPWERGQLLGSAALLMEGADHVEIPENALRMASQVLRTEAQAGHVEELMAASLAGIPWDFPNICLKCERPAFWRPIFTKPPEMPDENAWRYERPENRVPVCKRCAYRMEWTSPVVRQEIGYMVWGVRFEAFVVWHECWNRNGWVIGWDLEQFPLWPETCSGATWALGSGSLAAAEPRDPEGVYRREEHRALLEKYFPRRQVTRPFLTSPQPILVGLAPQ